MDTGRYKKNCEWETVSGIWTKDVWNNGRLEHLEQESEVFPLDHSIWSISTRPLNLRNQTASDVNYNL